MEELIDENLIVGHYSEPKTKPFEYRRTILESNARLWMTLVLLVTDMLGLLVAIGLSLVVRKSQGFGLDLSYDEMFFLLAVVLVIAFNRKGLYPAVGMNYVEELREIASCASFAFLILIGGTFVFKTTYIYSRLFLVIIWGLSLVTIPLGRYLIRRLFIRLQLWGEPVAIIGDGHNDSALVKYFKINLQLGLRPVTLLRDDYFSNANSGDISLMSLGQIKEYAQRLSLDTVLVVIKDLNDLDSLVNRYRFVFRRVILVKGRNGSYSLNRLKSMDFSDILGFQVMNNLLSFWAQLLKRIMDVTVASLGLLILLPFFGLAALLIKLDTGGNVFYRHPRLGRNGRQFELLKLRTMYPNADALLEKSLARDPGLKKEWDSYQKLKNDPRITRVGGWLRKFSLDELPQLWNVLRGEMSLVGPRPIQVDQRERYGVPFNEYVQVAPGITGLWQVSGRSQTTFARRAELDIEYIQRWSVSLDIYILIKTIKIVFWQQGAY